MSAGNQYAGEYDIKKCSIMSTKGIEFDIKSVIENISIFENIFTETISGIITINDTTDVVNNAPILGEEKLKLLLTTPQKDKKPTTTIDFTKTPLDLYKIGNFIGESENSTVVTLHFTSQEAYRNARVKISKAYRGSCSEILEKIFRDESFIGSKRPINIEETTGLKKFIFPNVTPFSCFSMLSKQSNSKNYKLSPSYLFYETTKGFNYRSIDGLCSQEPVLDYEENVPDQIEKSGAKNIVNNLQTITEFNVVSPRDTIKNTMNGVFSSNMTVHDIYNKSLYNYSYNYFNNFDEDTHLNKAPMVSKSKDIHNNKGIGDFSTSKKYVTISSSGQNFEELGKYSFKYDNLENIVMRRNSRMKQLQNSFTLNMTVYGNTFIKAGDTINVTIGSSSSVTNRKNDPNYSGKYLITKIRHEFNNSGEEQTHMMYMSCIKESVSTEIPSGTVDYSNKLKPESIVL